MKLENIRKGMKLKIVGTKGCCPHEKESKCKDCIPFIKGIIVTGFKECSDNSGQIVLGECFNYSKTNSHNCTFHPDDLVPFSNSWKEYYRGKK